MIVTRLCALILAVMATAGTARATVLVYDFSGYVGYSLVPGTGNILTGSFSYDNAAVPALNGSYGGDSGTYHGGSYVQYPAARMIAFESGSVSSVATGTQAGPEIDAFSQVANNIDDGMGPYDEFYLAIGGFGGTVTNGFYSMVLRFRDSSGMLYDSTGLPASLKFSDFDAITLYADTLDNVEFTGTITSLTPVAAAVPEPATWAFMLAGLALMGGAMRRRRQGGLPVPMAGRVMA